MGSDSKPRASRGGPLRTKPFEDSNSMRDALQRELRKAVSPSLVVILGADVGARAGLDRSVDMGRGPAQERRAADGGSGDGAVIDLASTNGIFVNGAPCDGAPLKPGDRIFVGKTVIEVQQ